MSVEPLAKIALLSFLLAALGCAQARPRFGQDVQTALARDEMRRLETPDMRVYYPASERDEALRIATRLQGCLDALHYRARVKNRSTREKANIVVPALPLNNAYVQPAALGSEHVAVLSTFETSDVFGLFGLPPDPATIGCHEMVHYVQARQIAAIPKTAEAIFGYLVTPQAGLDAWFWEGIATYYETRLQGGVGRLGSAYFRGAFASGVAERGLHESDLNEFTRRVPFNGAYLVGSHFIDWLVHKWGEPRLWEIIERQSDEVAFPLGVSGRFSNTYKKSLAGLFADFATDSKKSFPKRSRPPGQRAVRSLDQVARYAVAPDGTEAIVEQGLDTPPRLTVVSPDGREIVSRNLTDILPGRDLVQPSAYGVSGISFTADSHTLWFVALDVGRTFQVSRLVRVDLATGDFDVVHEDLGGPGGSIAPDGSSYVFSRARGDTWQLASFDTTTKAVRGIADYGPRTYVASARFSPDGRRLAATFYSQGGLEAKILDPRDGRVLERVAGPEGGSTEASWVDPDVVLFVAEHEGRLQVFRRSLATRRTERISDAPYVAFSPFAHRGRVRILSREGWQWSVDEIEAPPPAAPVTSAAPRSEARATSSPPPDPRLHVVEDAPYANDGLFVPTLRGPSAVAISNVTTVVGVGVTGGDRLGFHRWGLDASWDTTANEPSGRVQYIDTDLAPVFVSLEAARTAVQDRVRVETPAGETETVRYIRKETIASVSASRTFWTTLVTSGFRYDELGDSVVSYAESIPRTRRAAGPFAILEYVAEESTLAAGPRRALVVTASGAGFPALTAPAFADTRLAIRGTTPLPLSRRHTFSLGARGRALAGLPSSYPFLEVGGSSPLAFGGLQSSTGTENAFLPPTLSFVEPVRGFEDLGLFGTRAAIGEATYRMPIVFDTGSISTINVLPSFLFRQIDLEGFASAVSLLEPGREVGAAAGGAVIARLAFWRLPFALGIQVARRLTLDEGVSVSFAGGAGE
jgi:hypothetical protein